MATYTPNLNLIKPEDADFFTKNHQNGNMDILDALAAETAFIGSTPYDISILGRNYYETTKVIGASVTWLASDGAGHIVGVGSAGAVSRSSDNGETWTAGTLLSSAYVWSRVRWLNGKFIAVGQSSSTTASAYGIIAYSNDFGATWTLAYQASAISQFKDVAYNTVNGRYVAIGANWNNSSNNSVLAHSTNLSSWTYSGEGTLNMAYATSIAYGNGYFVAGTAQAYGYYAAGASPTSWTNFTSSAASTLNDAIYAAGKWILICTTQVWYCSAALPNSWSTATVAGAYGIAYDATDNIFSIPGGYYSTNGGSTWVNSGDDTGKNVNGCCYSQGRFIASSSSVVYFSENKIGYTYYVKDIDGTARSLGPQIAVGTYIGTGSTTNERTFDKPPVFLAIRETTDNGGSTLSPIIIIPPATQANGPASVSYSPYDAEKVFVSYSNQKKTITLSTSSNVSYVRNSSGIKYAYFAVFAY